MRAGAVLVMITVGLGGCAHREMAPEPFAAMTWPRDAQGNHLLTFRLRPERPAEHVFVAGEFNEWNPTATEMIDADGDGEYTVTLPFATGHHLYKFVLDGTEWLADPNNPWREAGGYHNSILYLGVDPADYPEDRAESPPPPPQGWLPAEQQEKPTPRAARDFTVEFRLPDNGYESVFVSGDFNGWTGQLDQLTLDPASREWRLALDMIEHPFFRYRFVVTRDGVATSIQDPSNPDITFDGHPVDSVGNIWNDPMKGDWDRGVIQVATPRLTATTSTCEARPIYVWLPQTYASDGQERYPVLYLHDGQNVFDDPFHPFGHGGWHVNTAAAALIASREILPLIIVAVPNDPERRLQEYGVGEDVFDASNHPYAHYLIDDVMPLINARYRTRAGPESTWLMGSSMGGVISLFLAYHHPEIFGQAACLSTAFSVSNERGHTLAHLVSAEGHRPIRVYLDSGTGGESEDGAPGTRAMRDLMIERGWTPGEDLVWHEEAGAPHNERAWRARVWRPLVFLRGRGAHTR